MAIKRQYYTGVTAGTPYTVAGGTGDDAKTANTMLGAGIATATYVDVAGSISGKGVRVNAATGDTERTFFPSTSAKVARYSVYITPNAAPTGQVEMIWLVDDGFATSIGIRTKADHKLLVYSAAGSAAYTFTTAMVLGTRYRLEVEATKDATPTSTNGVVRVALYLGNNTSPVETAYTSSAFHLSTTSGFVRWQGFKLSTGSPLDYTFDAERTEIGTVSTPFGPLTSNTNPTVVLDKTEAIAGEVITATAADSDGSVVSWALTGVSPAPAIVGTGLVRTFQAPITDVDVVQTLTVTDDDGGTGTDTLTIRESTGRSYWNGAWRRCYRETVTLVTQADALFVADDLTGADGSAVSSWTSRDGASTLTQATAANQPVLRTNGHNGHKLVDFLGLNDMLAAGGALLNAARNKSYLTVAIAYKLPSSAIANTRCLFALSSGTDAALARVSVMQRNASGFHLAGGRRLDADSFGSATSSTTSVQGEVAVLTASYRWATNDLVLYKNGVQIMQSLSFQTTGSTSDTASLSGFLGANAPGTAEWAHVGILEMGIYSPTDTDGSFAVSISEEMMTRYTVGSSMPTTEDVPGYVIDSSEDFLTDVAEGGFVNVTSGPDLGKLDPASPGGAAYSTKFKTKAVGPIPNETNADYDASLTTSVADSVFRVRLYFPGGTGRAKGGAIKPLFSVNNPDGENYIAHPRIRVRYRKTATPQTGTTAAGWGSIGIEMIGNAASWAAGEGEYGLSEGNHVTSRVGIWVRPSNHLPNPNNYAQFYAAEDAVPPAPSGINDWHIGELRSEPGRMRAYIDGVVIYDDSVDPPLDTDLFGLLMQSGKPGTAGVTTEAVMEWDWYVVSRWTGAGTYPNTYQGTY